MMLLNKKENETKTGKIEQRHTHEILFNYTMNKLRENSLVYLDFVIFQSNFELSTQSSGDKPF